MIDLHNHTTASDGELSPTALVERAAGLGVRALAVTDHDTVAGLAEAHEAGRRLGVDVVDGVELSATRAGGGTVHVLGYLFDRSSPALTEPLGRLQASRRLRNEGIAERLAALGVPVDLAAVRSRAHGVVGRPHFAAELIAQGHARSVDEVFDRWLARGRPAYVERDELRPDEAVRMIHAAGGVAVLAHPMVYAQSDERVERMIADLAAAGLDGVEIDYPSHTAGQMTMLDCFARRYGLVRTGGSDFHREQGLRPCPAPDGALDALRARREARAGATS